MNRCYTIVIVIAIALAAGVAADVPTAINYQGRLTDNVGDPVEDGDYALTFAIYNAALDGELLWSEEQELKVVDGLFSVLLGAREPLADSIFERPTCYLAIQVRSDPEIFPRTMLVTVPWAFRVSTVDGASGGQINGDIGISGKATIGSGHTNSGANAFVAGNNNTASGAFASVVGGYRNTASGIYTFVGGGFEDSASGSYASVGGGAYNAASGNSASVGGGRNNIASDSAATVGGGKFNFASGVYSVIAGGGGYWWADSNSASGSYSTIGGGRRNIAGAKYATVSGGENNQATDTAATIAGGSDNFAGSKWSTIGGGRNNYARGWYSVVAGGGGPATADSNSASGRESVVGGGSGNIASGANSVVSGGRGCTASEYHTVVSGGQFNKATGFLSTVGGGEVNTAFGYGSIIGGGISNHTSGFQTVIAGGSWDTAYGDYSAIVGGYYNRTSGEGSFIGGGINNRTAGDFSVVSGGGGWSDADSNSASGGWSVVSGGHRNVTVGTYASIPGGESNTAAGDFSFAAGRKAKANHRGTFVWADSTNADFASTGGNQFLIRASGGVGIGTNSPQARLHVKGPGWPRSFGYFDTESSGQDAGLRFYEEGVAKSHVFHNASTNTLMLYGDGYSGISIDANGDVGIGTSAPNYKLDVRGSIGSNTTLHHSDRRWKKNINTMSNSLDKVQHLRGVSFDWKQDEFAEMNFPEGKQIGLIAQEVEQVLPEVVNTDADGYKSVDYGKLVALLIEANKEQQKQNASQQDQIDELKKLVSKLVAGLTDQSIKQYGQIE